MKQLLQWFKSLKKPEEPFSSTEYAKLLRRDDKLDKESMEKYYHEDIATLRRALVRATTERKTPTAADFNEQLGKVLQASAALAHQHLLGISKDSDLAVVLRNNQWEAIGKLRFLVYEDINIPDDVAEALIQKYIDSEKDLPKPPNQ